MSTARFIHLRLHSSFSLLEGAISLKALPQMCRDAKMPAVGVTDIGNLFGALEFSETAAKAGIQPIIGCEFSLVAKGITAPIVLLAQNETGYLNLLELTSYNYLDAGDDLPHLPLEKLLSHSDGVIALTGVRGSALYRDSTPSGAWCHAICGAASDGTAAGGAGLCAGFAAGGDQQCAFSQARYVRGP